MEGVFEGRRTIVEVVDCLELICQGNIYRFIRHPCSLVCNVSALVARSQHSRYNLDLCFDVLSSVTETVGTNFMS